MFKTIRVRYDCVKKKKKKKKKKKLLRNNYTKKRKYEGTMNVILYARGMK